MTKLQGEGFKEFLDILSVLKTSDCADLDMKEGVVRTVVDGTRTFYDVDMTSIVGKLNLRLADLKSKTEILKIFSDSDFIEIDHDQSGDIIVKDDSTFIKISNVIYEILANKFRDSNPEEIFNNTTPIATVDISQKMINKFSVLAKQFGQIFVKVKFEGDKCSINLSSESKEYEASVCSFSTQLNINSVVDLPVKLFTFGFDLKDKNDTIKLILALDEKTKTVSVKTEGKIGTAPVKLYAKSRIE